MKGLSLHQRLTLLVILIVGLLLRFHNYGDWSLSNDELSALNRLHYNSFSEIMEEGVRLNDMHPPGIQAFLYIWTGIFGVSEHALRFPFVLLGIGSIYLLFLVAKTWFNTNVALTTTASFTALIFPILYSQLARPYSPGLFFTLLTVYYWTNIILTKNEKTSRGNFIGFILSGAACLYTHYFSFLFIAIVGITGLFFIKGNKLFAYVNCGVVMLLLLLPAYSIFNYQLAIGGLGGSGGWLGSPSSDTILLLIHYIFNESTLLLLFYTLLFLTLLFYLPKNRINGKKPMRLTALLFFSHLFCF